MSIARAGRQVLKVRRTLMFSATMLLQIKDLKDLIFFGIGGDYRHAGPTDLKRFFT